LSLKLKEKATIDQGEAMLYPSGQAHDACIRIPSQRKTTCFDAVLPHTLFFDTGPKTMTGRLQLSETLCKSFAESCHKRARMQTAT